MKYLGTLSSDARGSLSGVTASKNRGGNYFRARKKPSVPNTPSQQAIKTALSSMAGVWSNVLTAAQQAGWTLYGQTNPVPNNLGQKIILSGMNTFQRVNIPLVAAAGLTAIQDTSPGAVPFIGAPTIGAASTVVHTGTTSIVLALSQAIALGDYIFIYLSRPVAIGKVAAHQPFKLAQAYKTVSGDTGMTAKTLTPADPFAFNRKVGSPCLVKVVYISGSNVSSYGFATVTVT